MIFESVVVTLLHFRSILVLLNSYCPILQKRVRPLLSSFTRVIVLCYLEPCNIFDNRGTTPIALDLPRMMTMKAEEKRDWVTLHEKKKKNSSSYTSPHNELKKLLITKR